MEQKYFVMVCLEVHEASVEEAEKRVMRDISSFIECDFAYLVDSGECEYEEDE